MMAAFSRVYSRTASCPYPLSFTGGVRVAVGNLNAAGLAEVVTAAGPGAGPHVRGFSGTGNPAGLPSFLAY